MKKGIKQQVSIAILFMEFILIIELLKSKSVKLGKSLPGGTDP